MLFSKHSSLHRDQVLLKTAGLLMLMLILIVFLMLAAAAQGPGAALSPSGMLQQSCWGPQISVRAAAASLPC